LSDVSKGPYTVSTDVSRLHLDVIHGYLTNSYWSPGVPRDIVERAIKGSLCFGVYEGKRQVGFARVVTDYATYGYLADVFILDELQGKGLGTWLMEVIMAHPNLQGLRRFGLVTQDAHALYEKVGFQPLANPDRHMEIVRPDIYRKK